jgi:hypothetical protein
MKFSLANQLFYETRSLFRGYPHFVYSLNPQMLVNEVPVFVFHTIEPELFEKQLLFLKQNEYQTLSIADFYSFVSGNHHKLKKAVLLTIDDGRSSCWRFAYPLLRKYGFNATIFIIPGITEDSPYVRRNLINVWQNKVTLSELMQEDPLDETLCTWSEITEMFKSGHVDIENHTLFHKEVFTSNYPNDFIGPRCSFSPYATPVTAYLTQQNIGKPLVPERFYGLPLFPTSPLMQGKAFFKLTDEITDFCRKSYSGYYDERDLQQIWKKKIKKELYKSNLLSKLIFQDQLQIASTIYENINIAKELIQEKVSETAGTHLCLPFSIGSDIGIDAARKAGMKTCFWGVRIDHSITKPRQDPFHLPRIKSDFIWRLPGENRKSLLSIYSKKLSRRLAGQRIY